jgi:DNA-binding response OmpR family regulator
MKKKRVLVVDDEKDIVDMLIERLESAGYEAVGAYSGAEALCEVKKSPPKLIILDIMMPEIDGFDVLRELKSNSATAHIPVVMLTAKADSDSIFLAEKLGSADYIFKPFESKEFLSVVEKCILP